MTKTAPMTTDTSDLIEEADAQCIVDMDTTWERLKHASSHGVHVYRGPASTSRGHFHRSMCARTTFLGSLNMLTPLLRGSNAPFNRAFYGDLVDLTTLATLYHSDTKQIRLRHATMVYGTLARELVYLETQEEMAFKDGRRGYVCAMHSVDPSHKALLPPSATAGVPRAYVCHSGLVVRETTIPGVLDVAFVLHLDFLKHEAQTLCDKMMTQRLWSIRHLAHFAKPRVVRRLSSIFVK
ncbi:Aste57867_6941 [Aphanomyces stellatus]|uniref:Aste57867_6941 protein n=1 Tax=Aphanomyces stellatus TaxID=120398 RepID=A0A485KHG2_9STRA|nr:hypothetical protein As57867_006919 [Aphanomyces stellatus]VFT83893.1 Aste57867_6941 [Aphanomyces stellatus]